MHSFRFVSMPELPFCYADLSFTLSLCAVPTLLTAMAAYAPNPTTNTRAYPYLLYGCRL